MNRFIQSIGQFIRDEDGPTMFEYGLLIVLIAIAAIIGVTFFGVAVKMLFTDGLAGFP